MSSEEDINKLRDVRMKAAGRKLVTPTLRYLELLTQQREYIIESIFPSINGVKTKVTQDKHKISYITDPLVFCDNFHQLQISDYGLKHEFLLKSDQFVLKVPKLSSPVHTQRLANMMATIGWLTQFSVSLNENLSFYRCVFIRPDNPFKTFSELIATSEMNVDDQVFFESGLLSLTISGHDIDVIDYSQEKTHYLFIDTKKKIELQEFERIVKVVTIAYGFISGFLAGDAFFFLQASDSDFSIITGCLFKELDKTIDTGLALFDPRTIAELQNDQKLRRFSMLKPAIFSNILTKAFDDDRMLRAMKIIAEGNYYSNEIRASVYSVALETVRNIILGENEEKVAPIKDKNFANDLRNEFTRLVAEGKDEQFNNRSALYKRINQINQLPNKDSFKAAFALVGFELTDEDIKCLESRNVFLHGKLPVDEAEHIESEIKYFTHKLHFLVCGLILKYCGYYGWVVNSHKYLELFDPDYHKSQNEATFRTI